MNQRLIPLGLLLATGFLFAQEPPSRPAASTGQEAEQVPTFPAAVELVTVDVVVADKKGSPISGLTAEDFSLTEDGQAQQITSFEAIELPAEPPPAVPPRVPVSTNQRTDREPWTGRFFALVFDDIHMTPFQATRAKNAVAEFLKTAVRTGDRVTLAASGGGTWRTTEMPRGREELMTLLGTLDGRRIPRRSMDAMTDYEARQIHLYNDPMVMNRVMRRWERYGVVPEMDRDQNVNPYRADPEYGILPRAAETYYEAATRNRATLETLERVLGSFEGAKGRKSLILVSSGFIYDADLLEFKDALEASRRANAAIYFLDTRGMTGLTAHFGGDRPQPVDTQDIGAAFVEGLEAVAGSEHVAVDSGGFVVKNTNNLAQGIRRIADETRVYYLLGYHPTNAARDGAFREIEVEVARKGVKVRARKGYVAAADGEDAPEPVAGGVDPRMQRAADAPFEVEDVPLRLTAYVFEETLLGRARVVLATDVDIRKLAFRQEADRSLDDLDWVALVSNQETGEIFQDTQRAELRLLPGTRKKQEQSWFHIVREFELPPGGYQAKVIVRDANAGHIGSVFHEFEVPDLAGLRTSTPILSDTLLPPPEGSKARPRLSILARRTFTTSSILYHQYSVFGAVRGEASGLPQVRAGFEIRRADGEVYRGATPTLITPTPSGLLVRLSGNRLSDAEPGDYELVLTVTDEVTSKSLEVR